MVAHCAIKVAMCVLPLISNWRQKAPKYSKIPGFRHVISTRWLIFPQVWICSYIIQMICYPGLYSDFLWRCCSLHTVPSKLPCAFYHWFQFGTKKLQNIAKFQDFDMPYLLGDSYSHAFEYDSKLFRWCVIQAYIQIFFVGASSPTRYHQSCYVLPLFSMGGKN